MNRKKVPILYLLTLHLGCTTLTQALDDALKIAKSGPVEPDTVDLEEDEVIEESFVQVV